MDAGSSELTYFLEDDVVVAGVREELCSSRSSFFEPATHSIMQSLTDGPINSTLIHMNAPSQVHHNSDLLLASARHAQAQGAGSKRRRHCQHRALKAGEWCESARAAVSYAQHTGSAAVQAWGAGRRRHVVMTPGGTSLIP